MKAISDTGLRIPESIEATLAERGERYGAFKVHAEISQELKADMRSTPKWECLACDQSEALEMIVHKIARILNGDPNYEDSWRDIAGYALLVATRLQETHSPLSAIRYPQSEITPAPQSALDG